MYEGIEDIPMVRCPHCGSDKIRKAGHLPNGYQRYHCRNCNKKISALTTAKYFQMSDTPCPHCGSYHNRLAGRLKDGTRRRLCRNCGKGFSEKTIIREPITEKCPQCKSSNLIREGLRDGVQRYMCRDCGKTFTPGSQKEDFRKKKVQKFYRNGIPVCDLAKIFNLTERTIRKYTKRSNHTKHINKILETLSQKVKRDIIYFRLGAGVSYKDITQYMHVDKEVAEKVIENYLKVYQEEESEQLKSAKGKNG